MKMFYLIQLILITLALVEIIKFSKTKNATHGIWAVIILLVLFN